MYNVKWIWENIKHLRMFSGLQVWDQTRTVFWLNDISFIKHYIYV